MKEIFKELDVIGEFAETSVLYEIGFDSLKLMELIVLLEEKFNIEIDDDDLTEDNFRTIKDVENLIFRYIKE